MDLMKKVTYYLKNTDLYLVVIALTCSIYGIILVRSATLSYESSSYVMVQTAATLLGLVAFVIMSLFDLETMSGWWKIFYIMNIVLQLLLIPFGYEAGGQRAWIDLKITSLQPAELGKLLFIFTFSAHLSEIRDYIREWRGIFALALHTLIMMGVIVITSGDTGMAIQYFMIALVMIFAAGLPLRWLAGGAVAAAVSVPLLWNFVLRDYQKKRILVLFDPSIDVDTARQAINGKIAIGSGQLTGQGLGQGTMSQMHIVSANHTDYIFSVAGEELGFIGCMAIIVLLVLLILRILYVSYRASTTFSTMLAVGIGGMFLFQTFMNIFMNVGLLPVLGLTLPLFSYGGTSVLTMYAALGIVAGVRMREKPSWLQ